MLHKIQLFFLFSFLFISFLSAQDNETFAGMACKFISHNRAVLHYELQQKQTLVIQTSDGKELKLLCLWLPQTREEECRLDDAAVSLRQKVDKVLIGYGQTAGNPLFCYYLPTKKIGTIVKIDKLKKYRIPLSLCDYRF